MIPVWPILGIISAGGSAAYDLLVTNLPNWRYGKDEAGYRRVGSGLEPLVVPDPLERTPTDQFFVYSAGHHAEVDPATWSLRIHGDVGEEIRIGVAELEALTQHEVTSWLECAGNGRRLFNELAGHDIPDMFMQTPWLLGGLGLATWAGPRLRDVLNLAGVSPDAKWVSPGGLDDDIAEPESPRMCLPIAKALDGDTIVALHMNGEPLPVAHGSPARLLVPGWIGAYSMKWLGDIAVTNEWVSSWRSTEYYVLRDANGNSLGPATAHPVKSNLSMEYPATVEAGIHRFSGVARSGEARITEVFWRLDEGQWTLAAVEQPQFRWAWTPFSIEVELAPGAHRIETRAIDALGNTQPAVQPPHRNGVLWHAIIPHPVTVT